MDESQLLNEEQLLLLENLTYLIKQEPMRSLNKIYDECVVEGKELIVKDLVEGLDLDKLQDNKLYGSYVTGEDWKKIITAIQSDETLMDMKIVTVAGDPGLAENEERAEDSPQEGALSAVFVNEKTGEAVVAFRGTAEYEWKDNFLGGAATEAKDGVSTEYQLKALEWYQGLGLTDAGYTTITAIGHSKGGNKAKYITLMDTSITRCISYDGQGFSDEFYEKYKDEISRRQCVISNYNVEYDFVNLLLNDVGDTTYCKGFDYGEGKLLEAHCPNTFFWFDENGKARIEAVEEQAAGMVELNKFLNSYLRTLSAKQRVATMDFIGEMVEKGFSKELKGDLKTLMYIRSHSAIIMNLLIYAKGYAALHAQFTYAVKDIVEEFYSEEEITQNVENILLFLKKHTSLIEIQAIASFLYANIESKTKNVEDLQVISIYNPLERNRVFSINKLTALGRQGKVLMNTGSIVCMTWDDAISSLKELVDCLPGEAKSTVLTSCLETLNEKFYKEDYETMGEYIYTTASKIAEDIPTIDSEAAEAIDEITANLMTRISAIKSLESSLDVKPVQNNWGIGGF